MPSALKVNIVKNEFRDPVIITGRPGPERHLDWAGGGVKRSTDLRNKRGRPVITGIKLVTQMFHIFKFLQAGSISGSNSYY